MSHLNGTPAQAAVRRVGAALRDHGSRIDRHGGYWMAQRPADGHEDRTPSLSLAQGDVGAVLCCQYGCDTRDILAALNLSWADLFDEPRKAGDYAPKRVVAEYKYADENGDVLFVKVRYEPRDFRVKRPNGHGGWIWKIAGARRVLYRLPEVLAAISSGKTVYLVEGEKDADRLAALGYAATCNFDGAAKEGQRTKWHSRYGDTLRGADVVIVADRDDPARPTPGPRRRTWTARRRASVSSGPWSISRALMSATTSTPATRSPTSNRSPLTRLRPGTRPRTWPASPCTPWMR